MSAERYNRQIILEGFGESNQKKLANASVLVIGAGGLGCPALLYLTASGIGRIGLIDGDVISLSNLHRQILFSTADIGKLKAETAARKLAELNPEISIKPYPFYISQTNILDTIKPYDFIVDGTDNFESKYLINDACALLNKPLVFAAVSGYEGQLAVFNVEDGNKNKTNYRDIFPIQPKKGEIPNCAENGIIGVLPGIIGTMQAAEIIKLITGIGKPMVNKLLNYNLLQQSFYEIDLIAAPDNAYKIPKDESSFLKTNFGYPKDDKHYRVLEIDIKELENLQKKDSTILIDVRETHEIPKLNSANYKQFPMSVFEDLLDQEIKENNIVLLCQHGVRSIAAAEYLHEKYGINKNIYSLKGGIIRWKNFFTS
ncbi:HesA/MoeB/ThiF family protein [Pedobacter mendelii]|uniref:Molybdenum cofactor biosynthesis protein MoeB n=1 Tax=Pedobacter mendelii TaxID=1908240 RepID=A0ABQ2BGA4_9SPHI|nr:HesA/MoeB/ThiF family protein [Pedobacter mendelii]GGI25390.1 molybdenum cofactor biosynthesis protein MoeB [Pedobacter mendelii]